MFGNIFGRIRNRVSVGFREIGRRLWRKKQKRNYIDYEALDEDATQDTVDVVNDPFTKEDEFYVFDEMGTRMDTRLNIKLRGSMNNDDVTFCEPVYRGHLCTKASFAFSHGWSLVTGLTVAAKLHFVVDTLGRDVKSSLPPSIHSFLLSVLTLLEMIGEGHVRN